MAVIKNKKTNTYEVRTYYKDWTGARKQKTKRGFKRKCDAQDWERAFKLKENRSLDMTFGDFVNIYLNDFQKQDQKCYIFPAPRLWNVFFKHMFTSIHIICEDDSVALLTSSRHTAPVH